MDAKTLRALKASIRKWRRNAVAKTPHDFTTGADECALCVRFMDADCYGCPVREETGKGMCLGSPYRAADLARIAWLRGLAPADEAHAAARAEVAFLESLLPPGETA